MARLPEGILDKFYKITRYPIKIFLQDYIDFIEELKVNVYNYYAGKEKRPSIRAFDALDSLLERSLIIENIIENKRDSFNNAAAWELIEKLSDIQTDLETTSNASKWLRSAITKNNFNPKVEFQHTLRQLQTLEQVSQDILGSSNKEQDWVAISLRNDLREEDYSTKGGNTLSVVGKNNATIKLRSVVDNISGERVYGRDLDRKLTFEDDDLKSLGYKETVRQTVDILAGLRRGMTPEFPSDGISVGVSLGTNRRNTAFPIMIRQITSTFKRDDTLRTLSIKSISYEQDALKVMYQVGTRLGEAIEIETSI